MLLKKEKIWELFFSNSDTWGHRLENYSLWVKFNPSLIFVNKVLLELSHTHWFTCCLWLLCATWAEMHFCDMACKLWNIYSLTLNRNSLLALALDIFPVFQFDSYRVGNSCLHILTRKVNSLRYSLVKWNQLLFFVKSIKV